jgi:hypothetical protein
MQLNWMVLGVYSFVSVIRFTFAKLFCDHERFVFMDYVFDSASVTCVVLG